MINEEQLRDDLREEMGAAWQVFPFMVGGLGNLESANEKQLREMASMFGKDVDDYEEQDNMTLDLHQNNRY